MQQLASYAFRPNYETVDTVGAETGTNVQVGLLTLLTCSTTPSCQQQWEYVCRA